MGWSKNKTITILIFTLLASFAFAGLSITLIVQNLLKNEENQFSKSFTYLAATTFGTGVGMILHGCIWFRICQTRRTWSHAMIHLISFVCMLIGHGEIIKLLIDGEIAKCYNMYPISMLTIGIYIIQFILTLHFVLFRYGKTPHQRAFNTGMHAFIGAITLFVCITDGILVCHKISRDANFEDEITLTMATICIFFYGLAVWYIILNPYFDWRRLSNLQRTRPTKVKFTLV